MRFSLALLVALLLATNSSWAVSINTVVVGNPGNAGQGSGTGVNGSAADGDSPFTGIGTFAVVGAVNYSYQIGTTEVTNAQYVEFLNSKAISDPFDLYNTTMGSAVQGGILRSGASGSYSYSVKDAAAADDPVNYISFFDSIRFVNWLSNGQGSGDTETGSYTLLGGTPTPSNANTVVRNPGATWVLPTEDEWYKAAYFDPRTSALGGPAGDDHYWLYATQSDSQPTASIVDAAGNVSNPGPNVATFNNSASSDTISSVGAAGATSYYGTLDQAGNVWEWNETLIGTTRGFRGGSFQEVSHRMRSYVRAAQPSTASGQNYGFRVAPGSRTQQWVVGADGDGPGVLVAHEATLARELWRRVRLDSKIELAVFYFLKTQEFLR